VCFLDVIFYSFFRLTIILSHVFITVSLCDVRLSHLNKDYLLTYYLSSTYVGCNLYITEDLSVYISVCLSVCLCVSEEALTPRNPSDENFA